MAAPHVDENFRGALATIGDNAGHIKQGLARLKAQGRTDAPPDLILSPVDRTLCCLLIAKELHHPRITSRRSRPASVIAFSPSSLMR